MPIYEFQCKSCGAEVEVLQKINDPHLTDCEACGKAEMKKKVTAAAFRLSGAGWYETDFKDNDKKKNLTETASDNKEQKNGDDKKTNQDKTTQDSKSTSDEKKTKTTDKKPDISTKD